jgi:type IV fimbrial biogenesis protein FimT
MPQRQAGVSLIESATVTAVAALLVGTALPSFDEMRQRQQLKSVAAQLETDLHLARSEAVARAQSVRVRFAHSSAGSCYVIHTGSTDACSCGTGQEAQCTGVGEIVRSVQISTASGLQLQANSNSIQFSPDLGTVTPTGTLRLSTAALQINLVVNVMGRTRSCSAGGSLAGLPAC